MPLLPAFGAAATSAVAPPNWEPQVKPAPQALVKKRGKDRGEDAVGDGPQQKKGRPPKSKNYSLSECDYLLKCIVQCLHTPEDELWEKKIVPMMAAAGHAREADSFKGQFDKMANGEIQSRLGTEEQKQQLTDVAEQLYTEYYKLHNPSLGSSELLSNEQKENQRKGPLKKTGKDETRTGKGGKISNFIDMVTDKLEEMDNESGNGSPGAHEEIVVLRHQMEDMQHQITSSNNKVTDLQNQVKKGFDDILAKLSNNNK